MSHLRYTPDRTLSNFLIKFHFDICAEIITLILFESDGK